MQTASTAIYFRISYLRLVDTFLATLSPDNMADSSLLTNIRSHRESSPSYQNLSRKR